MNIVASADEAAMLPLPGREVEESLYELANDFGMLIKVHRFACVAVCPVSRRKFYVMHLVGGREHDDRQFLEGRLRPYPTQDIETI